MCSTGQALFRTMYEPIFNKSINHSHLLIKKLFFTGRYRRYRRRRPYRGRRYRRRRHGRRRHRRRGREFVDQDESKYEVEERSASKFILYLYGRELDSESVLNCFIKLVTSKLNALKINLYSWKLKLRSAVVGPGGERPTSQLI